MASNRTFTTVDELERTLTPHVPTLRLTLTREANNLQSSNPLNNHRHRSFVDKFRQRFNNLFRTSERTANFEDDRSEEALRRNQARVHAIFETMKNDLDEQRDEVMNEMKDLTPQQQEDVITFWSGVQTFFKDIMAWLRNMFEAVLETIRLGYQLVDKAVAEIFKTVGAWLKSLFG